MPRRFAKRRRRTAPAASDTCDDVALSDSEDEVPEAAAAVVAREDAVVPREAFEFVEPVLAAWQRQQDDIASLKEQLQVRDGELAELRLLHDAVDAEVAELRQRLQAKDAAFDALSADHAHALERHTGGPTDAAQTIAVMQSCIDDLRRDKTQLLQELERQRGDVDRLRRVMDRTHEDAQGKSSAASAWFMQYQQSVAEPMPTPSGLTLPGLPRFHPYVGRGGGDSRRP